MVHFDHVFTGSAHGRPHANRKVQVGQRAKSMLFHLEAMWMAVRRENGATVYLYNDNTRAH